MPYAFRQTWRRGRTLYNVLRDTQANALTWAVAAGGTAGYLRTRSTPSLVAGLGLGVSYAYAGYRIQQNQDYGTELALANSVLLLGSAVPRIIKTGARAPVPIALGATGALASYYYYKKMSEFRYGV